jgi:hypothetical protein
MLSDTDLGRIERLVRLAPYMTQEQREGLLKLIREIKAADAAAIMPQSAIEDLAKAVPTKLCQEIVQDLRSGVGEPGGFLGPEKTAPKERHSGPVNPTPLSPPAGVAHCDRIAEHFAALDKRDLEKRLRDQLNGQE